MTSRVDVRRKTDDTTTDENGWEIPVWEVVAYDVPFRLVGGDTRKVTVGGVDFQEATARGDLPWDQVDLADDDLIEVVEGEWADSLEALLVTIWTSSSGSTLPMISLRSSAGTRSRTCSGSCGQRERSGTPGLAPSLGGNLCN